MPLRLGSTRPPPLNSLVPAGQDAAASPKWDVPSTGAGSVKTPCAFTKIKPLRFRAVTLYGRMLLVVTEFFGAVLLIAIAVVPPATATTRARVAATFA
jgi:hypothetical protein